MGDSGNESHPIWVKRVILEWVKMILLTSH